VVYCSVLADLRGADEPRFGGKSANLGELIAAEIPVPPGFGVSIDAFQAFVAEAGLGGTIDAAVARVSAGDVDTIVAAAHAISEAMRFAPVPDAVREDVARCYAALAEEAHVDQPPVAVRSSAVGEDGQDATFAGQQETYLWVRGVDHVCDALRDCWVSLFSAPALSYRARLGDAAELPAMGVTVQLMVDAAVSGVMFTCNPVTGDPSMIAVNASWGLGLAVVGGEVTPDDFLVSKVTREIVREHVHDKTIEYAPDPSGRGVVRLDVSDERRSQRCVDEDDLAALADAARRIERYFGRHQDIEWAIARSGGELFVVQSRPVTALPERAAEPIASSAVSFVMRTFGADEAGA
jgi:pyruvate, water dikinase